MIRKMLAFCVLFVLLSSVAFAAGPSGIHEPGTDLENSELNQAGSGQGLQAQDGNATVQARERVRAKTSAELGEIVQQRQREMQQEMEGLNEGQKQVYQNQNRVRLAVHALLAMEDLTSIGPQVSAVATEFDNSVRATIRSEEKIQSRSAVARFFAGGDSETAEEIEQEVSRNQERVQELKQLREQCQDCDEQTRTMMQEQIQNMEQEQERLQELAQQEKQSKGLLGWLWK